MDDVQLGIVVRTARIRRGWRQSDLAGIVGLSDGTISRVERGHLSSVSLGALRRIAQALDIRVELLPRSRSANVHRLANARHADLAEAVIKWLLGLGGWIVRPEVSFSRYGERGVIDLLAWHPGRRALLVIELKTLIVDIGELLGTLDRKARDRARAWLGSRCGLDASGHRGQLDESPASRRARGDLCGFIAGTGRRAAAVAPRPDRRGPRPAVFLSSTSRASCPALPPSAAGHPCCCGRQTASFERG